MPEAESERYECISCRKAEKPSRNIDLSIHPPKVKSWLFPPTGQTRGCAQFASHPSKQENAGYEIDGDFNSKDITV